MKIGIVGWGVEGQSAYQYFGPGHEYLIVNEEPRDDFPPENDKVKVRYVDSGRQPGLTGNVADLSYLEGLDACDRIIYAVPSAKNLEKRFGRDKKFWAKTATVVQLFFENVKTKHVVGVTGTKGKGTTSTLVFEMLKAAGHKTFLGGNIGRSPLDFIDEVGPDDWVVLELSSFQLYNLTYSPHIGVCLMITPEHLEWHDDMTEYVEAKANLFRHQKKDDVAIYFENNDYSKRIAGYSPGVKIPYFYKPGAFVRADRKVVVGPEETEVIGLDEIRLLGGHNHQNVCAALTAVWFSLIEAEDQLKVRAAHQVLSTFSGLEHRLEFVKEVDGVGYYDDSFGTTPDTARVAIKAFVQPVVLILGGYDKRLDYTELIEDIAEHGRVRHVVTIGQIGPQLAEKRRKNKPAPLPYVWVTRPQFFIAGVRGPPPGDAVLLSAGTSSFGMFKDYKDRGNQFKTAVQALV
jgi:UDP-N-acetylmuramoylalanine--D-glutamate ligase